jgi:hypothetical protein
MFLQGEAPLGNCINVLCTVPIHGKIAKLLSVMASLFGLGHLHFASGEIYIRKILGCICYGVSTLRHRVYSF